MARTAEQRQRYHAAYYEKNRKKLNAQSKTYRENNKKLLAEKARERTYGVTAEQFDRMLASQYGACAICGTTKPPGNGFHVDHCHETGIFRGVLCHHCNAMLGAAKDAIWILKSAVMYLEQFEESDLPVSLEACPASAPASSSPAVGLPSSPHRPR